MADPNDPTTDDPRTGNPMNPRTWLGIGGVIIIVIGIGTVTIWNSGGKSKPKAAPPGTTITAPDTGPTTSAAATPDGTYRIIFSGKGTGSFEAPNNCQTFKSRKTESAWNLQYAYGNGASSAPDPATAHVTGTGDSKIWTKNPCLTGRAANLPVSGKDCHASAVTYTPNVSLLKRVGDGDTFSLTPPLAGDLTSTCGEAKDPTKPTTDPFYEAWSAVCPGPTAGATTTTPGAGGSYDNCDALGAFETAEFTIKAGQTGTVVTQIPTRTFHYKTEVAAGTMTNAVANHSWSGTITVVAP